MEDSGNLDVQAPTETPEEREFRRKGLLRDIRLYDPRRLRITREDLDEFGIEYDGDDLYVEPRNHA